MSKRRILIFSLSLMCMAVAMAGVPKGYYGRANGQKSAGLKAAMHEIVSKVTKVLTYGSGENSTWSGFYQTDRMANNQVRDRYSYGEFYFAESASDLAASAVSGMNIEHSFPKSWWGGSNNQAYKDLYNLMPCESSINTSKSNYAMGKVTSTKTNNGCTKVGTGPTATDTSASLWEPADKWKGDFARSYFYMVTAYSDLTWTSNGLDMLQNNDWPTLQQWAYELLLQWSREDPVDEIETARNEAVYMIQGNRNPYVDFPNLAEYVWGDSVDCVFTVEGGGTFDEGEYVLLNESFMAGLGVFQSIYRDGTESQMWESSSSYGAVANAYSKDKAADDYLVSPAIELKGMKDIRLSFEHAAGYHGTNDARSRFEVLVSTDYDGVPQAAHWDVLDVDFPGAPERGNFTNYCSVTDFDLTPYAGETIRLAFHYTASSSQCWAWEVRRLTLKATEDATGILTPDFTELQTVPDAVYTLDGVYVGSELPQRRGIYVVLQNGRTIKKQVR